MVLFMIITGINISYENLFLIVLPPIILPKMLYMLGSRNKGIVRITNWLESKDNSINRAIKKLNDKINGK